MKANLDPYVMLSAYAEGAFPMADENGQIHWYQADPRAVFDLDAFHVPRTLARIVEQRRFAVTVNRAFESVIDACADRPEGTWISRELRDAYVELHSRGFAHSVETWRDDTLAGGLYGVAIGGAFFGESMFFAVSNASKVALVHLVERLRSRGFVLLDTQVMTPHFRQFNCMQIPLAEYMQRLEVALSVVARFVD